ncbi:MAG: TrbG/VirB9 family P-type conjugative transfer protein [Proteobacteria bacterium]|nr:TrbG/VirB9 family P-type conjugative transfer protein [Burkholderiales bacterium]
MSGLGRLRSIALTFVAMSLAPSALAQQAPVPMPQDTRLVVFRYDANDSYLILTRPGAVTHLALDPDESVVALALGDTVQWIVQDKGPHVFVKPIRSDLFTSGTLVTNRRAYQLAFRSSPEGGTWYQRVSWAHPELVAIARDAETNRAKLEDEARRMREAQTVAQRLPLERLNFAYAIRGQGRFRPAQVLDDGRFTYIRLPAALPEMPALFVLGENGEGELVNYTMRGEFLVVQRLADRFTLRLGRAEVTIERERAVDGSTSSRRGWPAAGGEPSASEAAAQ